LKYPLISLEPKFDVFIQFLEALDFMNSRVQRLIGLSLIQPSVDDSFLIIIKDMVSQLSHLAAYETIIYYLSATVSRRVGASESEAKNLVKVEKGGEYRGNR